MGIFYEILWDLEDFSGFYSGKIFSSENVYPAFFKKTHHLHSISHRSVGRESPLPPSPGDIPATLCDSRNPHHRTHVDNRHLSTTARHHNDTNNQHRRLLLGKACRCRSGLKDDYIGINLDEFIAV